MATDVQEARALAVDARDLEVRLPHRRGSSNEPQTTWRERNCRDEGNPSAIAFASPLVPASFRFRHFAKVADGHGTISDSDAARLVKCWFAIDDPNELTARMLSSCRRVVELIRPLAKTPAALRPHAIRTADVEDLIVSDVALRQKVEGWLQCPLGDLTDSAAIRQHRAARKKRFNSMASRIGIYGGGLCDLMELLVQEELKRFALVCCYLSEELKANSESDLAQIETDFARLLEWAADYRTWRVEQQQLASSNTDPLADLRYLTDVPEVIKLCVLRVPGTETPHNENAVFKFAEEEISRFRSDASKWGVSGAMASSQYRNTGFDIDRLRADYAELLLWVEDWRFWNSSLVAEAKARKFGVLHKFQYLAELTHDVLITYCSRPGTSVALISIEQDLKLARVQLEEFLEKHAV